MKSRHRWKVFAALVALLSGGLVVLVSAPASAMTVVGSSGSGSYHCYAEPVKLFKNVYGKIVGKMKVTCDQAYDEIHVYAVLSTDSGVTYPTSPSAGATCYLASVCTETVKYPDLAGTQRWWLSNDAAGTNVVYAYNYTDILGSDCSAGWSGSSNWIWCDRAYGYF